MLFCNKTFYILFQLLAFGEYFMALGQQPAAAVFSHFKFKVFKRPLISLMVAPPPLASPASLLSCGLLAASSLGSLGHVTTSHEVAFLPCLII